MYLSIEEEERRETVRGSCSTPDIYLLAPPPTPSSRPACSVQPRLLGLWGAGQVAGMGGGGEGGAAFISLYGVNLIQTPGWVWTGEEYSIYLGVENLLDCPLEGGFLSRDKYN